LAQLARRALARLRTGAVRAAPDSRIGNTGIFHGTRTVTTAKMEA
jgi:hypothetical protein